MRRSYYYLFLVCLLAVILYLDRVCLSVAGPAMQDALGIGPELWGWVGTAFLIGYGIFEIPVGHWGDRVGARRVLTRIVVWWSAFTAMTGMVTAYPLLLGTRFLFGVGEAGALPNVGIAISEWFPVEKRGRAFGLYSMCTQIGGALSPLLVLPIQKRFGWRMSFYVFAVVGIAWAVWWFWQYRDRPNADGASSHALQGWGEILRGRNLQYVMALTFCYVYTLTFFQTWLHTYLVRGRGFSEQALYLSSLPYVFAAAANFAGGMVCDWLAKRVGRKWSRRGTGMIGLLVSAAFMGLAILATGQIPVILCLSMGYAGLTFQQPAVFTACLDIGGRRGGVVMGCMNTAGQLGGAVSSAVFGYLVTAGGYEAPLAPMAALLLLGVVFWSQVDVTAGAATKLSS